MNLCACNYVYPLYVHDEGEAARFFFIKQRFLLWQKFTFISHFALRISHLKSYIFVVWTFLTSLFMSEFVFVAFNKSFNVRFVSVYAEKSDYCTENRKRINLKENK